LCLREGTGPEAIAERLVSFIDSATIGDSDQETWMSDWP
jgi:hypothetical protein